MQCKVVEVEADELAGREFIMLVPPGYPAQEAWVFVQAGNDVAHLRGRIAYLEWEGRQAAPTLAG